MTTETNAESPSEQGSASSRCSGSDERRIKLIEQIQEAASRFDAMAQSEAMDSVRNLGDEERRQKAAVVVAKADAYHKLASEVIAMINFAWPR